eukprot:6207210-Prymnesium_polylepis.1
MLLPRRAQPFILGLARRRSYAAVRLHQRPGPNHAVEPSHFALEHASPPLDPLAPDAVRCRTLFLSVDPFLRCRFNEETGVEYTRPYAVGKVLTSAGVGEVTEVGAAVTSFRPGDVVVDPFDSWPWASICDLGADEQARVTRLPPALLALLPPTALLGAVGQ